MKNLTPEMIEKAKAVKSAEELLALAKENDIEMTADEAATFFAQLNPKSGELDDDDLDSVAGGACAEREPIPYGTKVRVIGHTCKKCGTNVGVYSVGAGYCYDYIECKSCNYIIANDDGTITYEVIE